MFGYQLFQGYPNMSQPDKESLQILIDKLAKVHERVYLAIMDNIL
jgi:hypothetical protein